MVVEIVVFVVTKFTFFLGTEFYPEIECDNCKTKYNPKKMSLEEYLEHYNVCFSSSADLFGKQQRIKVFHDKLDEYARCPNCKHMSRNIGTYPEYFEEYFKKQDEEMKIYANRQEERDIAEFERLYGFRPKTWCYFWFSISYDRTAVDYKMTLPSTLGLCNLCRHRALDEELKATELGICKNCLAIYKKKCPEGDIYH